MSLDILLVITALLFLSGKLSETGVPSSLSLFCRNEKDSQGENMFLRCVSEIVIESREVRLPSSVQLKFISSLKSLLVRTVLELLTLSA